MWEEIALSLLKKYTERNGLHHEYTIVADAA
jgi:hypothetical protein